MRHKIFAFTLIGIIVLFCHSISSAGDIIKVSKQDQSFSTANMSQYTQNAIIYKRNGRKLVCDRVWRDKNIIFLVVHGKRFAIGYRKDEINMKKSFPRNT